MKFLVAVLAFMMLGQAQAARSSQNDEAVTIQGQAPKKRTMIYDERTGELVEVSPQVESSANANNQSPIYILNNQKFNGQQGTTQLSAQEQPTTVIQETALKPSGADNIRKKRVETEAQTEDGIVQALEKARLEDEMKRREKFSGAIGATQNQEQVQTQTTVISTPAPVQATVVQQQQQAQAQQQVVAPAVVATPVAAPAVVVVEREKEVERDYRSEIRTSIEEKKPEVVDSKYYVSGLLGMGKYPDVINVTGDFAAGVAVGSTIADRIVAEGSFIMGKYELEGLYSRIVDMKQYNFAAAVKYVILTGKVQPNVAALASYTRRSFSDMYTDSFKSSNALDVGLGVGTDIVLNPTFAIGLDFRYYTNAYVKQDRQYRAAFFYPQEGDDIEKLDYYTTSLTAKFLF